MQNPMWLVKMIGVAICLSLTTPVFAESAPVYDVDSMQQQVDNGEEQGQDLPPPPPPSQEGAYVPNQSSSQPQQTQPMVSSLSAEQRLQRVEQQVLNMQNNDTAARVDSLQDQVQSLRSQIEQLTHQLEQVQDQQKNTYADLDKRFSQLNNNASKQPVKATVPRDLLSDANPVTTSSADVAAASASGSATRKVNAKQASVKASINNQPNVAEEQQVYQTAYNLIKEKKYAEAVNALQSMLKKYPTGQFAANAHYWLGELYGLMNKNDQALNEFSLVVKTYPDSPRISDAQLKIALIYATQSKWSDAKAAFKKVINRYPGTASATLAQEQLKQMKQAGH